MISREIMLKNVTIRDIAEAAGVSHTAVLKVLNGRHAGVRISAATRARILAIVHQSGYRPNRIASDMALGRHTTLGLVMAPGGPDASAAHLAATEAALAAAGYRLTLIVLPADPGVARDRVAALLHDGVAGLLCAPSIWSIAAQIAAGTCPVIALGQGAGETILKALGVEVKVSKVESPESKVEDRATPPPAIPASPSSHPDIEPIKPAPAILPIPIVVAAVPGGVDPVEANPVLEPMVTPSPVFEPIEPLPPVLDTVPAIPEVTTPPPVSVPIITPEPGVTEPPPPQTPEPPVIPESVTVTNPLGEVNPSRAPEPAITAPPPVTPVPLPVSDVVAAVPSGIDPVAANPVSEPMVTPAPVFEQIVIPPPVLSPEPAIPEVTPPLPAPAPSPAVLTPGASPSVATDPVIGTIPLEGGDPSPPAPEPIIIPPNPVVPVPPPDSTIPSTTQQPDNSSTSPEPIPPADIPAEDGPATETQT